MKIYQVRILTEDFTKSFQFYRDTFGLTPVWGDESGPYAGFSVDGETQIAIFHREGMAEAIPAIGKATPGSSPIVVLEVDSVDDRYRQLRERGVEFENAPRDYPGWTIRAVHLRDPDGTLIELFEPLPDDQWTDDAREKDARAREPLPPGR